MDLPLASPDRVLERLLAAFEPRATPPIDVWAERNRRLASGGDGAARSNRPGRLDLSLTPYVRQPLRDWTHPAVREISYQKSAQIGASEAFGVTCMMYSAVVERQPVVVVYPTETTGTKFNRRRLIPSLRASEATRDLIGRVRDVKATELNIGGVLVWFAWSNSRATMKSDPVGRAVLDEIDEYPPGWEAHGNARARGTTFPDRKLADFSTPEDPETGITYRYEHAEHRHRFCVPCPVTGRFFELWDFGLLRWAGGSRAQPDRAEADTWLQSPYVHVPKHLRETETAGRVREAHKAWMVRHGLWLRQGEEVESDGRILETLDPAKRTPGAGFAWLSELDADALREPCRDPRARTRLLLGAAEPDPRAADAAERLGVRIVGGDEGAAGRIPPAATRSYRSNELASLIGGTWGEIAADFIRTGGDANWQKNRLGQAPGVRGDAGSAHDLKKLAAPVSAGGYPVATAPEGVVLLYAGVDVQKDCVWVAVWGFGPVEVDPALIDAFRLSRDEAGRLYDVEADLLELAYPLHGREGVIRPAGFAVDSGHWTEDVYRLTDRLAARDPRRTWMSVKGRRTLGGKPWSLATVEEQWSGTKRVARGDAQRVLHVSTDHYKTVLHAITRAGGEDDRPDLFEQLGGAGARLARLPDGESRGWSFHDGRKTRDFEDAIAQMTAERRVTKTVGGMPVRVWEPRRQGIANHLGDCGVYAHALADFCGVQSLTAADVAAYQESRARPEAAAKRKRRRFRGADVAWQG